MLDVHHSSGPTSSKLRDSCHNCAVSKVKCPREKPTCSRCKTRGIICQYFVVKRPGRRRMSTSPNSSNKRNNNNSNNNNNNNNSNNSDNNNDNDNSHEDGAPANGTDDTIHFITPPLSHSSTSLQPENALMADFSDALSAFGDIGVSAGLPDFGSELPSMDFFMSSMDASFGLPVLDDIAAFIPAESMLSTRQTSVPCSDACPGGCLTQALDLLKSISVDASAAGSASASPAQAQLLEYKLSIDAVNRMLVCSCTEDGFLLTVLSMIVLKVLGQYAAAAARDAAQQPSCGYGTPPAEDDEQQRIAARLVLSELHRVQRLVNQLSPRLKGRQDMGRSQGSLQGWEPERDIRRCQPGILGDKDDPPAMLFSASTMDQMEGDLRKSLSTLSLGIIHNLRQT